MNINRFDILKRSIGRLGLLAFAISAWLAFFELTWGCWAAPLCG